MSGFDLSEYVDVAERIRRFYEAHPDGRIETTTRAERFTAGDRVFVWMQASAYRTPDDPHPGVGTAWEPIPGPTPYTRDSELMNAETAAWGRAIIAAGIPSKKVASADEVRSRTEVPATDGQDGNEKLSPAQMRKLGAVIGELKERNTPLPPDAESWEDYARKQAGVRSRKDLTSKAAHALIDHLEAMKVPFG